MAGAALQRAGREVEATEALLGARAAPVGKGVEVRGAFGWPGAPGPPGERGAGRGRDAAAGDRDSERIELRLDLLTSDAVRVRAGAPVDVVNWGGDRVPAGRVRMVEPAAFTRSPPSASRSSG